MACTCGSSRHARVSAKTDDRACVAIVGGRAVGGYPPSDMGIGGGDYVNFTYCLDCGRIQGKWPLPPCELEQPEEEEEG